MSSNNSHELYRNADWAVQVGRFVLAFGDIEHMVTFCLRCLPRDSIGEACATLPLGARLNLLEELLAGSKDPLRNELLDVVRRVRRYVDRRNLIAHNGMQFNVHVQDDRLMIVPAIVSSRKRTNFINYSDLVALADEVSALADELSDVGLEVVQEEHPELAE